MSVDAPQMTCPDCGVPMSFIRERTEVTIDGMRHSFWDFWCSQHGLWHYDVDTKEINRRETSDLGSMREQL